MKTLLLAGMLFLLAGCYVSDPYYPPVVAGPPPPTGVRAVGLIGAVDVYWNPVYYSGIWGYRVYRAPAYEGPFTLIGSTGTTAFRDLYVVRGYVYYYAVTTVDVYGYESTYSYDNAWAIPGDGPTEAGFDITRLKQPSEPGPTIRPDGPFRLETKGGRP